MINVTEKEYQELVNQFYRGELDITMKELYNDYNIVLELQPTHNNEDINKLINMFCTSHTENENSITFKGLQPNNYLHFDRYLNNDFKAMYEAFNGYREAYYNSKDLVSVSTCEGDIYITIFNNEAAFNRDYETSLQFYEEN